MSIVLTLSKHALIKQMFTCVNKLSFTLKKKTKTPKPTMIFFTCDLSTGMWTGSLLDPLHTCPSLRSPAVCSRTCNVLATPQPVHWQRYFWPWPKVSSCPLDTCLSGKKMSKRNTYVNKDDSDFFSFDYSMQSKMTCSWIAMHFLKIMSWKL